MLIKSFRCHVKSNIKLFVKENQPFQAKFSSSSLTDTLKRLDRNKNDSNRPNILIEQQEPTGFDLALFRAANIIRSITENQATKLLQVHSDGRLFGHMGPVISVEYSLM